MTTICFYPRAHWLFLRCFVSAAIAFMAMGCGSRSAPQDPLAGGFRPYLSTRGDEAVRARGLVEEAQGLSKAGRFAEAVLKLRAAEKAYPDEDNLLLLAATQSKLSASCQAPACNQGKPLCEAALDAWQAYLDRCRRCRQGPKPYATYGAEQQAKLGARCGAQLLVESEPTRARLSVDEQARGQTPAALWLREGRHSYALQGINNLSARGEVTLQVGERRRLQLQLRAKPSGGVEVVATLYCAASEKGGRCADRLNAGQFHLKLESTLASYLYLFSESDEVLTLVFPSAGMSNHLSAGSTLRFPPEGGLELDPGTSAERLHLLFSARPLSLLSRAGPLEPAIEGKVRQLFQHPSVRREAARPDQVSARGSEGFAVISWTLREPPVAMSHSSTRAPL
ncbi:MAG: hypothetical protein VYD19_11050 [Myxococcota bacterium]|nr:hypothetical protein [Myxococcota bacterium]